MTSNQANVLEALSQTSRKNGTYDFLIGLMAMIMFSFLGLLGYVIKQNSDALQSIPKEISALNVTVSSMNSRIEMIERQSNRIYEIDKKLDFFILKKINPEGMLETNK